MKRKLFVAALVLILALAMLPSFALADGPLDQLKADIAAAPTNGAETRVELTGNITDFTTRRYHYHPGGAEHRPRHEWLHHHCCR